MTMTTDRKTLLVARSPTRLNEIARELVGARVIAEDLARPGAARRVFEAVQSQGLEVDVLINNVGFAKYGPFTEVPLEVQREQIDLNVGVLVELTHLFLPMLERRQGG